MFGKSFFKSSYTVSAVGCAVVDIKYDLIASRCLLRLTVAMVHLLLMIIIIIITFFGILSILRARKVKNSIFMFCSFLFQDGEFCSKKKLQPCFAKIMELLYIICSIVSYI